MKDRQTAAPEPIEETLEPELQICDAHHHLWDLKNSRYLVDEFLRDVSGHRVTKTIYVECLSKYRNDGPKRMRPVGETEFVDQITAHCQKKDNPTHMAAGIVAFADLSLGYAVDEVLQAHSQASSRFCGIRHVSAWDASEQVHNGHTNPPRYLLSDALFREGFSCLEKRDLTFDAWVYFHQIPEIIDLASAFPEVRIILNHVGGPVGIGPYSYKRDEIFDIWRGHMRDLAACENVFVKLGGLTMAAAGFGWHKRIKPASSMELAEAMAPYYHYCIDMFGPSRCMFESNFPIDSTGCTYHMLWNSFKRVSRGYSTEERAALFHDTAARVYHLKS
ncbi:MAG: amidohydrolase family protein [Emcibacter sp.]|nr:amidohydrolase family protein [Emcibacter sp.]